MHAVDVLCFEKPFRFSLHEMLNFAEAANAHAVIADIDEEMAGFGIVHVERVEGVRFGYITTLDVAPVHRRKGVAEALMKEMERLAAADDCGVMRLHVFVENVAAIAFYERIGYVFAFRDRGFYGAGRDALVWEKALA